MANIELEPTEIKLGRIKRGDPVELEVRIHDVRPETHVVGHATTTGDILRLLPATQDGYDVVLHLLVRTLKKTPLGPAVVKLQVHANDEQHDVPIHYEVESRRNEWLDRLIGRVR